MNQMSDSPATQKRGAIHKCPSCGAQLAAFVSACEACGHEFTDIEANRSILALTQRFEDIEREADERGLKGRHREQAIVTKRARVIRDFPVPNSREDLQQLMFFIQPKIVASVQPDPNLEDWRSKFLEVLNRARNAYRNDAAALAEFDRVEASLQSSVGQDLQIKAKRNPLLFALLGGVVILGGIGVVSSQLDSHKAQQCEDQYVQAAHDESARLRIVAGEADQQYRGKNYSAAQTAAAKLRWELADGSCKQSDNQQARSLWDGKRAELSALIAGAVAAEQAAVNAAAERATAEKVATEQKSAEVARIAADKEKAREVEKKW
ncbi:hypothetical protein GJ699_15980 [Duganella sp. FT80W]|uniref:Uncharacterized protein n=1 Tax=Duganella guangzhouensis TaxID=2666084 RepID=A0A6I2L0W9_9BURK|nr:zinc ribbon domain-containing protein [Duganella guangzhouensis]MRW91492.1 hypothetical protein [Duganella guangzhouensis]